MSQWVLSCAEEVSGKVFHHHGDAIAEGIPDRDRGSPKTLADTSRVVTTSLQLGEQVAQRVAMSPSHLSQVHADGLSDATLGTWCTTCWPK